MTGDFEGDATDIRYQCMINCDLQMVGEDFSRKPYAVAVQNGSPLRDQLNDAILRLLNQRRLETLKERWWTDNPERKVCTDQNNQSDGISIQNIGMSILIGHIASTSHHFKRFHFKSSLNYCTKTKVK